MRHPADGGLASELKFLVDSGLGARILEWARQRLDPDPHGGGAGGDTYAISSLYLDTAALDVFHRRGSYGRIKYRVRRYEEEGTIYLERKLRRGDRLAKRRTRAAAACLPCLGDGLPPADPAFWFARRVAARRLKPTCQVSYLRAARILGSNGAAARLTVDDRLVAAPIDGYGFVPVRGTPLLPGHMIVELKFRGYLPAVFRQLLETFALEPRSASKYRVAAAALGLADAHA